MLTVWGRQDSSNVQALMWCIGELGLPCRRHDAGHRFGGTDTPGFRAMNPNGTVPVLQDESGRAGGGEPLWETGAILRTLCACYASAPFWPGDGPARARIDQWAEWAKINVAAGFTAPVFWRVVRTAPADRDPAALAQAMAKLGRFLDVAEDRLARSAYLAGDDLTLADIQFGSVLFRYFDVPIERAPRLALRRYYDTLTERPAYREHVMISYEALRVPA